jgi:hypothetical protein
LKTKLSKKSIIQASWYIFSLLSDKFKDFKVDNIFEKAILSKEYSIRNKRDRYLKAENSVSK